MSKKIASNGASRMFGGLRTPNAGAEKGMRPKLNPSIASNTMRPEIKTGAARVRSAQTMGQVVKPF